MHESEKKKPAEIEEYSDALFTKSSKKLGKCFYCKKLGHFAQDCFKKKRDEKKNESISYIDRNHEANNELALKSSTASLQEDE